MLDVGLAKPYSCWGLGTAMCQACEWIDISSSLIGCGRCRWCHVISDLMKSDTNFPHGLFFIQSSVSCVFSFSIYFLLCQLLVIWFAVLSFRDSRDKVESY